MYARCLNKKIHPVEAHQVHGKEKKNVLEAEVTTIQQKQKIFLPLQISF
jgi:hypothetical protein